MTGCFFRSGKRFSGRVFSLVWLPLAAALGAGSGSARAAETAGASSTPPGRILREKTVYIPYKKLKEIFEKEGRGVFLPYEEFLRLWHEAQKKPPPPPPEGPPAEAVIRGGSYVGSVAGKVAEFKVDYTIDALKKGWSELPLPLRDTALESVKLSDPEALFAPKGDSYALFLPRPGSYTAVVEFSVRVEEAPGRKTLSFGVPPAGVSRLELTIPEPGVRIDVRPTLAVTQTAAGKENTKVLAFLGNADRLSVSWFPPPGKGVEGAAVLLASQAVKVYLGERILRIATDIGFQVVRGETDTLKIRVPASTRLLSVKGENIRRWSRKEDVLTVALHSPLKEAGSGTDRKGGGAAKTYRLSLTFERILASTPAALTVPFPVAEGVIRESGWVVFNNSQGLNVRIEKTTGLSQLDPKEVPAVLRSDLGVAFRYLAQPVGLSLSVEKITPRIRSFAVSVVILGREEDRWSGWVDYKIEKAGLFKLRLQVPGRWTVVSAGDSRTVEDFQSVENSDGTKTVTVNLKSKALGSFRLPFAFSARGSASPGEKNLSAPAVLDSREDRGLFGISAPKAFSVTTVERTKVTSADVDELLRSGLLNKVGPDSGMPLTYGYREPGGSVKVRLEAKKTEIDVLAQHLVEITDGGINLTHILDYEIRYAPVESVKFSAPSSLDSVLKVESKEKKEVRRISTNGGTTTWEIALQAAKVGSVTLTITHSAELKALEAGTPFPFAVPLVRPADVGELNGFVAVRKEGTLEISARASEMESIDAGDLPDKLRRGQIYAAFRYFAAEPSLNLTLTRYEYQRLATTIVNLLHLKSVLSEERRLKTEAVFMVQNTDRQFLEISFPEGVKIFSVSVAGKPQKPRQRKADARTRLIQIPASAGRAGTFPVVVVYEERLSEKALGTLGQVSLRTPEVLGDVPVAKVELELFLSPDFAYLSWAGTLKPAFRAGPGLWQRFKDFVDSVVYAENRKTPVVSRARSCGGSLRGSAAGPVDIEIPTRGYVKHDFETLAPVGTLSFFYVGRGLFSFIDFLAFLVALLAGYLLLFRVRLQKPLAALFLVFVPLCLVWFSRGAIVEIFTSLFAGGFLLFAGLSAASLWRGVKGYREARLALAPDPYLEEAEPPKAKEEIEGGKAGKESPAGEESPAEKEPPGEEEEKNDSSSDQGFEKNGRS